MCVEAGPPPSADPLTRPAQTGTVNPVQVRPFELLTVVCPSPWDASGAPLPVLWEINDPHHRIRSGRILYEARLGSGWVVVHRRALRAAQWTPGSHELSPGDRWDGIVHEGIEDCDGEKVTADLSTLRVTVEVWNTTNPEPAPRVPDGNGRTERAREWVSSADAMVVIDAIVEAHWDTDWVIPAADPEEPAKGEAGMIIRVKNVREGMPVHIAVKRILRVSNPPIDQPYVDDVGSRDLQAHLQGAIVRGDRVVLPDGSNPRCRFNNFDEHWIPEGNNFYAFWLAFGNGDMMAASERDYVNHEQDCVHMRFTVFIHIGIPNWHECVDSGHQLHAFFRRTRYYRSYLMIGPPATLRDWWDYFKNRYIVIFNGHGACGCEHPEHPREPDPRATPAPGAPPPTRPMELLHRGFEPDRYVCPTEILNTPSASRGIRSDRAHYHHNFGGCGHETDVFHQLCLGQVQGSGAYFNGWSPDLETHIVPLFRVTGTDDRDIDMNTIAPRMFLYAMACRTMLTPNLGDRFISATPGTQYFSGWVYSVFAEIGSRHLVTFFRRWIQGSSSDPAPNEYDVSRIPQAFRDASRLGNAEVCHPRMMDGGGVYSRQADPSSVESALQ